MHYELMIDGKVQPTVDISILQQAVDGLYDHVDSFIVLAPEMLINGSIYLQAAINERTYMLETRLDFGAAFSHYRYTTTSKEKVFNDFVRYFREQKLPDLSLWQDVTDEF